MLVYTFINHPFKTVYCRRSMYIVNIPSGYLYICVEPFIFNWKSYDNDYNETHTIYIYIYIQ